MRIWVDLFLFGAYRRGLGGANLSCLFWSFGASRAGRCEFWTGLELSDQLLVVAVSVVFIVIVVFVISIFFSEKKGFSVKRGEAIE